MKKYLLILVTIFILVSCNVDGKTEVEESVTLHSFSIGDVNADIDNTTGDVYIKVPYGSVVESLVAKFGLDIGDKLTVNGLRQISGETKNDFTNTVVYTLETKNGTKFNYNVYVTIGDANYPEITSFFVSDVAGVIDQDTIVVTLPFGTTIGAFTPTFSADTGSVVKVGTVIQISGENSNDFSSADGVIYTVIGADTSITKYTVKVVTTLANYAEITSFTVGEYESVIDQTNKTIKLEVPNGTDRTSLVATFSTSGTSVKVGITTQVSGKTYNNFTSAVTYVVIAYDSTEFKYTVTLTEVEYIYTDYTVTKFDAGVSVTDSVPSVDREFRALYVTTVANLDWPSKMGLTEVAQKAEVQTILDNAEALNLNAIVFQVRGVGDAFYISDKEPWSQYLSGQVGTDPEYDPLQYWIDEAHKRGMLLHAWVNPYRVGSITDRSNTSYFNSMSPANDDSLDVKVLMDDKIKNNNLWLNPGHPATEAYVLSVVKDILAYDVDGLVMDDYFYPYLSYNTGHTYDANDRTTQFPDGGTGTATDSYTGDTVHNWRRGIINSFVKKVYALIKTDNPDAIYGLSPFGLYKSDGTSPAGSYGLDAYNMLACDSLHWLQDDMADYIAPQLYWPEDYYGAPANPINYSNLLDWWSDPVQNSNNRHMWPALTQYYASWKADDTVKSFADRATELATQVALEQTKSVADGDTIGYLFFRARMLQDTTFYTDNNYVPDGDTSGDVDTIKSALLAEQPKKALIPATTWRDGATPSAPVFTATVVDGGLDVEFGAINSAEFYVVYIKSVSAGTWTAHITQGLQVAEDASFIGYRLKIADASDISDVIVTSVSKLGIESAKNIKSI